MGKKIWVTKAELRKMVEAAAAEKEPCADCGKLLCDCSTDNVAEGKVWITRAELRQLVRESFKINEDLRSTNWGSEVDEDMPKQKPEKQASSSAKNIKTNSWGSEVGEDMPFAPPVQKTPAKPKLPSFPSDPGARERVLSPKKDASGGPSRSDTQPVIEPATKPIMEPVTEPMQRKVQRQAQQKKPRVTKTVLRPSGRIRHTGEIKQDPTAKKPFSKNELRSGADVDSDTRSPMTINVKDSRPNNKKPGILDRIKKMLSNDANKTGFEPAPTHWSRQQKEKFHSDRAKAMNNKTAYYAKMFSQAKKINDEKKKIYAKKMYKFYFDAARKHENFLRNKNESRKINK